jgi:Integrase core domain
LGFADSPQSSGLGPIAPQFESGHELSWPQTPQENVDPSSLSTVAKHTPSLEVVGGEPFMSRTENMSARPSSRELLGWHLSRSGRSKTAEAALEQALIARYGCLGRVKHPFLLRSDNGLVFTSRSYTALVKSYGLQQEFITPYSPEQNGMVERVIRTLKEQCVHRHRFETLQHASRVIGDWIGFYNHRRPHQALGMKTPAEAYALAA